MIGFSSEDTFGKKKTHVEEMKTALLALPYKNRPVAQITNSKVTRDTSVVEAAFNFLSSSAAHKHIGQVGIIVLRML